MKPKHHYHHIPLCLLGIPFLLLNPVAQAQTQGQDERAAKVAETEETPEEKGDARRAKETARRAKMAAKEGAEAAERAEDAAKQSAKVAETQKTEEEKVNAERAKLASERAKEAATPGRGERGAQRPTPDTRERPVTPATPAIPATPATPADGNKPPVEVPVVPVDPPKPREGMKPRTTDTLPSREATAEPALDENAKRDIVEIPVSETERLAETKVTEVTREVQQEIEQRKTRIEGPTQAQALINELLGAESRISRAEIAREERFRPRFERQRPGEPPLPVVSPDQRRAATTYYQERLLGREVEGPPPEFFRRSERRGDGRDVRIEERVVERVEYVRPRYLNDGRRYVHYDSRASIPAILMAAQAMNQVRFQPTREIAPIFHGRQDVSTTYGVPLPPENYRTDSSVVVSYPVDEKSMISSEDILFLQGSTQFADPYSYEVIEVMADAMKAMPEDERFVIEGHASAEGSYESNMILSQQRAEHIVREIVRRGISPYRLLPVGYGESEARHLGEAAEHLRGQDRRVVVFRMKPEPLAQR